MFFSEVDEREYGVKPMNCPGHTQIFAHERRSYRDLPLRIADFARLHRYERSGVTHGLDARAVVRAGRRPPVRHPGAARGRRWSARCKLIEEMYAVFGFQNVRVALSTRPEKRLGSDEVWDEAERALKRALKAHGTAYHINPGEGAFYGPEARVPGARRDRPPVAARNRPARLQRCRSGSISITSARTTRSIGRS